MREKKNCNRNVEKRGIETENRTKSEKNQEKQKNLKKKKEMNWNQHGMEK